MDRPINTQVAAKRKRNLILRIGIISTGVIGFFFLLSAWISPSINRKEILTATVKQGSIEGTISASGIVVPKFEQAISSPAETRILSVRKKPGEHVTKGESILELDRSEISLSLEKIEKEISLKANSRNQLKLDMEKTINDLQGQLRVKELRLQYSKSKTEQGEKMFTIGAVSKDQMDQMKLEEQIASIEKEDLEKSIKSTSLSLENQLDGITTEVKTMMKEKADIQRRLDRSSCGAENDGVVTWVKDEVGSSVHTGEIIARVADLSSYRVEVTVSDIHASRLFVGMPAKLRINEATFPGTIETVYPMIENGTAKALIAIADSAQSTLRPNLRADVFLITGKRSNTLKVKKGPFVNGTTEQNVFVIRESLAKKIPVKIGISNFEEVEIMNGVSAGDEIIISDMTEYEHLAEIKVR